MADDERRPASIDWQADFEALLAGLARNYANFEYTLTDRRLDLPALAARYRTQLAGAPTDAARRAVFESLLRDFRDPHVAVDWNPGRGAETRPVCAGASADAAPNVSLVFARLADYAALETGAARSFHAGILRSPGRPAIGIVRIHLFVEREFAPACQAAARALGLRLDQPCDAVCAEQVDRAAAQWLNRELVATVQALERAGAQRLAIDITDNGGGSDWAEVVARMLGGPLQSARIAMLKHPAWHVFLDEQLRAIDAALATASPPERGRLQAAANAVAVARRRLTPDCDLGSAWSDRDLALGRRPLPCTALVNTDYFASGPEQSAHYTGRPGPVDALLFTPARYGEFPTGVTRLPLVVIVDRNTHSAAEQFAALLRDNGRAIVIGEPTAGAACGTFTDSGTGFTLPASGARIHVPDCVRLRADGSNERRGITPDRTVPWAPSDSAYQRARKAADLLYAIRVPRKPATPR